VNEEAPRDTGMRRVAGNAAWYAGADLIGKVASFVLAVLLARHLGARSYGYFNFALSFFPLFLMLAQWGTELIVVRELSGDPERVGDIYASGLAVRVTLGSAAVAVGVAALPALVGARAPLGAVLIIGVALFVDELTRLHAAVFTAFDRMRVNALNILVNRVVSTALAVVVVAAGRGLTAVCLMYLAGSLGALSVAVFNVRRSFPAARVRRLRRETVRALVRGGAPFGIAGMLNMAVFRIDAVLLLGFKGPVQVALYGVAYRFFEPLLVVAWSLASASLPDMTRAARRGRDRTFPLSLALVLAFYLPIALGAPFTARWLVVGLFSARYRAASGAVAWLAGAALFYAAAHLARTAVVAAGRRATITWIAGATLLLNVGLNLAFIPQYGFLGAAAVTFFTELAECAALITVYVRSTTVVPVWPALALPVSAGTAMGAVLILAGVSGAAALAVGATVYGATLLVVDRLLDHPLLAAWESAGPRSASLGPAEPGMAID